MANNGYCIQLDQNGADVVVTVFRDPATTPVDVNTGTQARLSIPHLQDQGFSSPVTANVSAATSAAPIVLTVAVASGAGFVSGDAVLVEDVGGNTNANGTFIIGTVAGSASGSTVSLTGSKANAAFTTVGTITKLNPAKGFHTALAAAMIAILNDKATNG